VALSPDERDTTLLVIQHLLKDFYDYNDFLNVADDCSVALGLEGEIRRLPVFIRSINLRALTKTTSPISPTDRRTPPCTCFVRPVLTVR
jgi:hypothetical protein